MERSLDPDLLRLALGEHAALPSPEEVSRLLASAELALLLHRPEVSTELISIGWYLHGIASSKYALQVYGVERQRAAFSISGHIFDLILQSPGVNRIDRMKYCFAAQIAYLRSTLDPNSLAVYRREFAAELSSVSLLSHFQEVSLSCGIAFLGFDVNYIFTTVRAIRSEIARLVPKWEVGSIFSTQFGSAAGVALGTWDLMVFLVYGRSGALDRAREWLRIAVTSKNSLEDSISRWIAAHLLNLANEIDRVSIWTVLPPDVPPSIRKAFAMGYPRILTLWPPQLNLLAMEEKGGFNPFSANVKRLFISTPTSGGKSLLAQLLVTAYLSHEQKSVCYIAPTRSLCNEIRKSLESRMRFLGKEIVSGLPEGDWFDGLSDLEPEVEVMTPERLSYLIRSDSVRLLEQFGMFIFDEVHLVGEPDRGWTLEEDLAYIHYATKDTNHRIALVSAVIGNRNHFVAWMSGDNQTVIHQHTNWRGPRRLHAIWTTEVDWNNLNREILERSRKYPYRDHYPVHGLLHIRISQTGEIHSLRTVNPVGDLVFKIPTQGDRVIDNNRSTPFYQSLIPIIQHLAESGPILIVESTRPRTVSMAKSIADSLNEIDQPELIPLIDLVQLRLGSEHPLSQVLRKGVAYHHGSLPDEIRTSIEEAVSLGYLHYLVATTTLTEGVNLPVKSVVIASQGAYAAGGYVEYIKGPKLINAIGRAGRAAKETEGVVVLARQGQLNRDDFDRLSPDDSQIQISSMLATESALNELATFEELQRVAQDAVFMTTDREVADFLAFVWFMAAELERISGLYSLDQIREILEHTLAWVQLSPENKQRWLTAAQLALLRYQDTTPSQRRRWAAAGTSLSSASETEMIARELAAILRDTPVPENPVELVALIIADGRLSRILDLPEAPKKRVFTQRGGQGRVEIEVSFEELLRDWLHGVDLITIANTHFRNVLDIDFRFEQLGDFIYDYFEIYFPWILGTIIAWTNEIFHEENIDILLPKTIPANIRWGVDNPIALQLMIRGVQSRSLAFRIAQRWSAIEREGNVFDWIRSMTLAEWQQIFDASLADLRNILELVRNKKGGAAVDLIMNGSGNLEFESVIPEMEKTGASLELMGDSDLDPVCIRVREEVIGYIPSRDQSDIRSLMSTGLMISVRVSAASKHGLLELELVDPEE